MESTQARTECADHPPSTDGTSTGRARHWPLAVAFLAAAAVAVVTPMVAAEPASAPVRPGPAVEAYTSTTQAGPTAEEVAELQAAQDLNTLNEAVWVNTVNHNTWVANEEARLAAEEEARQAAAAEAAAKAKAAQAQSSAPGYTASGARCGGSLPPCYVMNRESGGSLTAKNPSSTASGKWQFLDSTWGGYGGYAHAWQAPESVQDARAAQLWAGGGGCGHWSAC